MKKFSVIASLLCLFFIQSQSTLAVSLPEERKQLIIERQNIQRELKNSKRSRTVVMQLRRELREIQKLIKQRLQAKQENQSSLPWREIQTVEIDRTGNANSVESLVSTHETGTASYYADNLVGRLTASGEMFSNDLMTAAHRTLPFGTKVLVRNLSNGRTVEVVINDRGPYAQGRIIDLSSAAFAELDNLSKGLLEVELELLN